MATVYVSSRCTNCQRFVGALRRSQVADSARVVDVDVAGPVRGLEYVPTVADGAGGVHAGTRAFEWLKQYESLDELDPAGFGGAGLPFSMVDDATGTAAYADPFAPFTPPV